jgi:hypothetical protein
MEESKIMIKTERSRESKQKVDLFDEISPTAKNGPKHI